MWFISSDFWARHDFKPCGSLAVHLRKPGQPGFQRRAAVCLLPNELSSGAALRLASDLRVEWQGVVQQRVSLSTTFEIPIGCRHRLIVVFQLPLLRMPAAQRVHLVNKLQIPIEIAMQWAWPAPLVGWVMFRKSERRAVVGR